MEGSIKISKHELVMFLVGMVAIALIVSFTKHRNSVAKRNEGFVQRMSAPDAYSSCDWFSSLKNNPKGPRSPSETVESGQMTFFANTEQSTECLPSIYSGSSGGVCASVEQMKYLNQRGGNRTLPSEY